MKSLYNSMIRTTNNRRSTSLMLQLLGMFIHSNFIFCGDWNLENFIYWGLWGAIVFVWWNISCSEMCFNLDKENDFLLHRFENAIVMKNAFTSKVKSMKYVSMKYGKSWPLSIFRKKKILHRKSAEINYMGHILYITYHRDGRMPTIWSYSTAHHTLNIHLYSSK